MADGSNSNPLGIVVVSDLHAGKDHPFGELATTDGGARSEYFNRHQLAEQISSTLGDVAPSRRVLVCGGDLTAACHSDEFELACRFLSGLADDLKIPEGHRLLVPGNHDIDWELTRLGESKGDAWYDGLRQKKFDEVAERVAPSFARCSGGRVTVVEASEIDTAFFLLDSPWGDRHNRTPHHGEVGAGQLKDLEQRLEATVATLKVVVLHHHVRTMRRTADARDFSLVNDAADLERVLREQRVDMVIHGHAHRAAVEWVNETGAQRLILSAGTTTAHHRLPEDSACTFHTICIQSPGHFRGAVHTRCLSGVKGWSIPSYRTHGLPGRKRFGPVPDLKAMDDLAQAAMDLCKEKRLVRLGDYLSQNESASNLCPHDFGDFISRAKGFENEFEVVHDADRDQCQLQLGARGEL